VERPAADLGRQAGESFQRYLSDGRPYDLDAAIELWEKAAQRSDAASPDLGDHLGMLGIALRMRFERTESRSDLDGALEAESAGIACSSQGSANLAMYLDALGVIRAYRYRLTREPFEIDGAIAAHENALLAARRAQSLPASTAQIYHNLGMDHWHKYEAEERSRDLELALEAWTHAVDLFESTDAERIEHALTLADGLAARSRVNNNVGDLRAAVALRADSFIKMSGRSPDLLAQYHHLGTELLELYERAGDPMDLSRAISTWDTAANIARALGGPDVSPTMHNLGAARLLLYQQTNRIMDLEAAIAAFEEALWSWSSDGPDGEEHRLSLAQALEERHRRTGSQSDQARAANLRGPAG
jgi:tetratricopeptide (TPR) repeat protein